LNIRFLSRASLELAEAVEFYDKQRIGLGNELLTELDSTLNTIVSFPKAWPLVRGSVRRALLARFPYGVLYRATSNEITIAAFMDLRGDPEDFDQL
jgi:hypothetical protein